MKFPEVCRTVVWKKNLFGTMLLFLSCISGAQQLPVYNQYIFNPLLINPACAGNQERLNATVLYRRQWMDIPGAPSTQVFSIHSPVPKKKIALGLLALHDQVGVTKKTGVYGIYAYRITLKNKSMISFGLQGGIAQWTSRYSDLQTKQSNDPHMSDDEVIYMIPEFGTGICWSSDKYSIGISVPDLLMVRINELAQGIRYRHHFIHGSYTVKISPQLKYMPVVLMKYTAGSRPQVDVNNLIIFNDVVCLGMNYRSSAALHFLLQAQITNQLQIGYSYEIPASRFRVSSGASHEFKIAYRFEFFKNNTAMPRYF